MKVINHEFPKDQYYEKKTSKKGVVLHHTSSGEGVNGDINWWKSTKAHICTPIIIERNGDVHRLYSSKFWGHHLGIKPKHFGLFGLPNNNVELNKEFIGLEIDSWGGLVERNGEYYSWTNTKVAAENVIYYENGYRGYYYFEKYTKEQIQAVKELLLYWKNYYDIDISYKGAIMFEFNERAISGEAGVWAHTSYRPDKSDVHPQKELIEMLESL